MATSQTASRADPAAATSLRGEGGRSLRVQLALAVLSGLLVGFSQPVVIEALGDDPIDPTGLTGALAVIGLVPLLVALRHCGPKRAYWLAFTALLVQFTCNVQWLVVAMVVFGRIPLVLSWLILLLLTSAMAAYVAAGFAVARMIVGRYSSSTRRVPMWLALPVCLTAAEALRNYGPVGGFPWANIGTSFATVPLLLQAAALAGVHGLVFLAGMTNATIATLVGEKLEGRPLDRRAAVALVASLVVWIGFGAARLATEPTGAPTVRVGLLQGNIEQGIRNHDTWTGRKILTRYQGLSAEALARDAKLLVWPEAAYPVRLRRDITTFDAAVVGGGQAPQALVVGAVAYQPSTERGKRFEARHNSAFVVGEGLEVKGRVDKTHLVPFGEYVPWPFGAIVDQIVPIGGTTPGEDFVPVAVALDTSAGRRDVKIGTTICYEGIFPEISRALANNGMELHVNITNDGWYGISAAPVQHLNFYSMRAVESGRPVVRAANTGRSAWVDTRGRQHDVTPIYTDRAVVADVPLDSSTTPYLVLGEWVGAPCVLLALILWIGAMLGHDVRRRSRARFEAVLGVVGLVVAVAAPIVFFATRKWAEEQNATIALLITVFGLFVGVGALSARPWARKAQLVLGAGAVSFGLLFLAMHPGPVPAVVVLAGAFVLVQAVRRASHYTRAVEPLVLDDA